MSTSLRQLLVSARSKNAGPFAVGFDLFFGDVSTFERAVAAPGLTPEAIARVYQLEPKDVLVTTVPAALAVKVAIPRLKTGGSPGDTDVSGGQQFVPLLDIEVP